MKTNSTVALRVIRIDCARVDTAVLGFVAIAHVTVIVQVDNTVISIT